MPGPARTGAIIFARDVLRLSKFYCALLGMQVVHIGPDRHVIESDDTQLVIHGLPAQLAASVQIQTPPVRREQAAIRPFFSVPSLVEAEQTARALGGVLEIPEWSSREFKVREGMDPEGNLFHLREFLSP